VIGHTASQLGLSYEQIMELMESLEGDGFKTVAADWSGLISSLNLVKAAALPKKLGEVATPTFFPTNLEVFISKDGFILLLLNGWYTFFDIPCGVSRRIDRVEQAIKYFEEKISSVVKEQASIRIIKGVRRCLFEHPGAYEGYF
jgi:hypothetical protein